ncbi:MAG: 50S ribosomal protein L23 [Phycisphaerales bacterium]|nr:50S ribosomal protein L23 [Phycisphaerales bacterium]
MDARHIVKEPLLTEKQTYMSDQHNRYGFLVAREATKTEIKEAIQSLYKVRVLSVNTHNRTSRIRRYKYGAIEGKTTKRAVVRVHPEDKIELV